MATPTLTFEQSLSLTRLSPTTFRPLHPQWTWPNSTVVPGGCLMSMAAHAAYQTLPADPAYALDNLHCQFLSGSNPDEPYTITIQPLTDGKRFRVRSAVVTQAGRNIVSVTMAFINASPWKGPSMRHSVPRVGKERVREITIDDLERGRTVRGGYMKFQRLPLVHRDPREVHTSVKPVVAHIIGPMQAETGTIPHVLGLLNLSDYHVLAAPSDLHGYTLGLPAIGDASGKPTEAMASMFTSLNHTVHIHSYDFRADELMYVEVTSPWTGDGRGMANSRIFNQKGDLIASCVQETYHVLKPGQKSLFESKL
ncbi:Acyl-coenzyme A thioesterase 8 [Cyphellophora attinorum]|uniref:Acyl-coenzyme A thioesterase 8 n=1 Tax=Cyphellophora attinorum TaxID=1664694 RepID=A0A0N1H5N5_9EURO|nr:Acyl-coenzyme A thioesterase 8 [Phialophora attinorum]KPI37766.1 Acyl-coenzyme A thioesterase 8 [Phialophora attinorum]